MAKTIELLKRSQVPEPVKRAAARGVLSLPKEEMLEILVFLSADANYGDDARQTLSTWDVQTLGSMLSAPDASRDVLAYFLAPKRRIAELMPTLIENPGVTEATLLVIAETGAREDVDSLLQSTRVQSLPEIQKMLLQNPNLSEAERKSIREKLGLPQSELGHLVFDHEVNLWIMEHSSEIAAEEGKAFSLVAGTAGDQIAADGSAEAQEVNQDALAAAIETAPPEDLERLSTLQKLARMSVGERVKVAMIGNKEERSILIRDGARIVSSAVLASPKISEQEIETYSAQKNVQESVLRDIARNRKFIKSYVVVKNLVNNPRCPLDLGLNLVKNLIVTDLKSLSTNKNVSDTLRKIAMKLFKERSAPVGSKPNY